MQVFGIVEMDRYLTYRYHPLYPNMDNPYSRLIRSPRQITCWSLISFSACLIQNLPRLKDFHLVFLSRIKPETPVFWSFVRIVRGLRDEPIRTTRDPLFFYRNFASFVSQKVKKKHHVWWLKINHFFIPKLEVNSIINRNFLNVTDQSKQKKTAFCKKQEGKFLLFYCG